MPPNQQPNQPGLEPLPPAGPQPVPPSGGPIMQTAGQPQQISNSPDIQPNPNTTQSSLLLSELREGMAIMKDGSFRAVIACQSINFDLMSGREREGIEYSYQNFLNSLYFPVQI